MGGVWDRSTRCAAEHGDCGRGRRDIREWISNRILLVPIEHLGIDVPRFTAAGAQLGIDSAAPAKAFSSETTLLAVSPHGRTKIYILGPWGHAA